MFKYIEYLRRKPDSYKKRFSVMTSFFIVGLIFVIWLSVVYPDVKTMSQKKADVKKDEPSAFKAFTANIMEGFGSIGEGYSKIGESLSDINNIIESGYYSATSTGEFYGENSPTSSGVFYDTEVGTSTENSQNSTSTEGFSE